MESSSSHFPLHLLTQNNLLTIIKKMNLVSYVRFRRTSKFMNTFTQKHANHIYSMRVDSIHFKKLSNSAEKQKEGLKILVSINEEGHEFSVAEASRKLSGFRVSTIYLSSHDPCYDVQEEEVFALLNAIQNRCYTLTVHDSCLRPFFPNIVSRMETTVLFTNENTAERIAHLSRTKTVIFTPTRDLEKMTRIKVNRTAEKVVVQCIPQSDEVNGKELLNRWLKEDLFPTAKHVEIIFDFEDAGRRPLLEEVEQRMEMEFKPKTSVGKSSGSTAVFPSPFGTSAVAIRLVKTWEMSLHFIKNPTDDVIEEPFGDTFDNAFER